MHCLHFIDFTNITIVCLLTINYERLKVTGKVIMAWAPAGGDKNRRSPSPLEISAKWGGGGGYFCQLMGAFIICMWGSILGLLPPYTNLACVHGPRASKLIKHGTLFTYVQNSATTS